MSTEATNPATLFGGTWERIANGRMLIGADNASYPAGSTGGEAAHTLTLHEIPSHFHEMSRPPYVMSEWIEGSDVYAQQTTTAKWARGGTMENGGGLPHNNLPPYLSVYMWRRTA